MPLGVVIEIGEDIEVMPQMRSDLPRLLRQLGVGVPGREQAGTPVEAKVGEVRRDDIMARLVGRILDAERCMVPPE